MWGTGTYADNSTVCSAAVQSGSIPYESGGIVTIQHLPGQASYTGSTKNGITNASLGVDRADQDREHEARQRRARREDGRRRLDGVRVPVPRPERRALPLYLPAARRLRRALRDEHLHRRQLAVRCFSQLGLFTPTTSGRVTNQIVTRKASYPSGSAKASRAGGDERARELHGAWPRPRWRWWRRRWRRRRNDPDHDDDRRRRNRDAHRHVDRDGARERRPVHDGDDPVRRHGRRHERPPDAHDLDGDADGVRRQRGDGRVQALPRPRQ